MINRTVLVGRITKDPEIKYTQTNVPVVSFTLAVNRQFQDVNGEKQADFINCVVWRKQSENMSKYVKKGALLGIEGRLSTRNYEDKDGKTVYITEVVCDSVQFLESKNSNQSQDDTKSPHDYQSQNDLHEAPKSLNNDNDLPF